MKLSRDNSHLRYRNYEDILQFGTKWRTLLYLCAHFVLSRPRKYVFFTSGKIRTDIFFLYFNNYNNETQMGKLKSRVFRYLYST